MAGQLQDGLLDAFLYASGVPIPAFSEAETQGEVVFLDFTAEEVGKLTAKFPELSPSTLPASTYRTAGRPLSVVGMFNFASGHKSLPDDLVFEAVKAVLRQNDRLKQAISAASETLASNAGKNTFLPITPAPRGTCARPGRPFPTSW